MATSSTKPRRSLKRKQTYTKDSEHSEPAPKRARTTKGPSITWEKFYMSVAQLESQRSNCAEHNKVSRDYYDKLERLHYGDDGSRCSCLAFCEHRACVYFVDAIYGRP